MELAILAFPFSALILGLIDIAIIVAVLLLVGCVILWVASLLSFAIPAMVQKLYIVVVALIALYYLVGLLFGVVPVPGFFR